MEDQTTSRVEPEKPWWKERAQLAVAILAIVAISLVSLLGFGFFFIPIAIGALFIWLFVVALRRVEFRNTLSDERAHLDQRYADGQPFERSMEHDRERPYRDRDEMPPPAIGPGHDPSRHAP